MQGKLLEIRQCLSGVTCVAVSRCTLLGTLASGNQQGAQLTDALLADSHTNPGVAGEMSVALRLLTTVRSEGNTLEPL